jgi:hypothetical protein
MVRTRDDGDVMSQPDEQRSRLRAIVAEMNLALVDVGTAPVHDVWRQMVAALALGPEPAVRACPRCNKIGMLEATRCGYCWITLAPLSA